jgi:hypothetical protein
MNGELAQLAALVAHGNEWLKSDRPRPTDVASGSTFRFVNDVRFEMSTGWLKKKSLTADSPDAWLEACAERGMTALWLGPHPMAAGQLPAHLAAAFANGTQCSIVAVGRRSERWVAGWSVGRPGAPDNRIWDVLYVGSPDRNSWVENPDLDTARERLERQVSAARDLATQFGWTDWAEWFAEALAAGKSNELRGRFHDDVMPASADRARWQLFALASGSYVFGGMGSWNDLGAPDPQGEAAYQRISMELYSAVLEAVAASVSPRSAKGR